MKIAFFTDSYYPMINGVTISVDNFADELRILGHTVYIFAPKFDDYTDVKKDIYRFNSFKVLDTQPAVHMPFMLPHQMVNKLQPLEFDIIHAHGNGFFSLLGYQVALMKNVPYILTFHTQMTLYTHYLLKGKIITPRVAAASLRVLGNICDTTITPSEKMKKELLSYGVKKPIRVVPNFVYIEKFTSTDRNYLRTLCGIGSTGTILLSVSRLGKEKNVMFLLKAFKKIVKESPDTHLVVVGYGDDEMLLKDYVKKNGLGKSVHFTGKISPEEIAKVYAGADIFVFASTSEVHPMVILEAAASGLPFVVVDDGAYDGIVENGRNGYVVPLKINTFAKKVVELVNNPSEQKAFGKISREIIKANFSPETLTVGLLDVYKDTIVNRKPGRLNIRRINKATLKRLYQMTDVLDRIFQ